MTVEKVETIIQYIVCMHRFEVSLILFF